MSKLDLAYAVVNGTAVNAIPVEANFSNIETFANAELIERDGTVAMRAQLQLVGNPVSAFDAAPKGYVDTILPIGVCIPYLGVGSPPGGVWLEANGASLATATWPELFAVAAYRWGGSGGNFLLPNLSDRVPMGTSGTKALGSTGGSADLVVPTHSHVMDHTHPASGIESTTHIHNVTDHLHSAGALGTSNPGDHHHVVPTPGSSGFVTNGTGNNGSAGIAAGGGLAFATATSDAGAHAHTLTGFTGAADRALATDGDSVHHTHATTAMAGSTQSAGVSPTLANLPPYVTLTWIVRAR